MAKKYYAVRKGKVCGIFLTWDACRYAVDGVAGAEHKSFSRFEDAEAYITGERAAESPDARKGSLKESVPYAYVDGSYNAATRVYGYGGFLQDGDEQVVIQGSGKDAQMAAMRNIAGEILGCMAAVEKALARGLRELVVYYDYSGIEMWATGAWKRNKEGTIRYYEYMQSVKDRIKVSFVKVKGHSGVEGNEMADRLAKEAAGLTAGARDDEFD